MNVYPIRLIPADCLTPSPHNAWFDADRQDPLRYSSDEDLTTSIRHVGLLDPLVVVGPYHDGCYRILSGVRRYKAIMAIRRDDPTFLAEVPCCIVGDSDMPEDCQKLIIGTANLEQELFKHPDAFRFMLMSILRRMVDNEENSMKTLAHSWADALKDSSQYSGAYHYLFDAPKEKQDKRPKKTARTTTARARKKAESASKHPIPPKETLSSYDDITDEPFEEDESEYASLDDLYSKSAEPEDEWDYDDYDSDDDDDDDDPNYYR